MSNEHRDDLIEDMGTAMRQFMAHAVLYQDAVARWAGLHATDLQCAGLLLLEGPMTPSELAARTGLTTGGAITAVIDRLEKAGLATRTRDESDRRRVHVTPDADALIARVGPVYARVGARWADYLRDLGDEQIELITEALNQATALNREEIDWLRDAPRPDAATSRTRPAR
jgi:DNA-binding MarR family transcriptional regulator